MIDIIKNGICEYCIIKKSCNEKCEKKLYEELKNEAIQLTEVFSSWKKKQIKQKK